MIAVHRLSKSFGRRTLWSDLSLTVKGGEMLAVTGPSGSGKSTLLNCIGLLEPPTSGQIMYDGADITRFGRRRGRRFRRDVLGYLFQSYALIENATVADNLEVAVTTRRDRRSRYRDALERVGLAGRENEKIHHLSGGEQQRVALARLLVKRPSLILADEPTGALDHANAAMVINTLQEMSNSGCAVIIATHSDYIQGECDAAFDVSTF
ncbi:ATP-binding cassette domain-containing protein [Actinoallomurus rhizosphaericola]|uniref:ATP-binding cassette domain-containing protein n=1 Tax=Actinoallomurus rhizosphaericola TaxID=2952536 RepID=UPI0020931890|nr:ATP-binding cassette domain-containing protein [Actinoallomurus rhizosphaericola]MCO5999242.1 ATP-binding cassette domain-containing protein [Actinoallomurus rhizosphaericola]